MHEIPRLLRGAVAALALTLAGRAAADCPSPVKKQLIPLPVYATLPNEGDTWGVMPVILRICPDDRRTESVIAPSATWNSVIKFTSTFRLYHYPRPDTTLTTIVSASTRTNYNALLVWEKLPTPAGAWTSEFLGRVQRTAFERFFGLGPATPASAESSYTSLRFIANARRGLNVVEHLNLGLSVGLERDSVEAIGVPNLPLTRQAFPDAPGIRGATLASQGLDLRYDDRSGGDYTERGLRIDLGGAVVEGLEHSPAFVRGTMQARGVVRELPRLSGAARLHVNAVSSHRAPFYHQSTLGGSRLLRGFTDRRFVGRHAWTFELEQRLTVLRTEIFGVVTDWRIDPFVAVGQVFDRLGEVVSRPRLAFGSGFRAFVHPNVVGRIDVASAGEGLKVYVEIGYPY